MERFEMPTERGRLHAFTFAVSIVAMLFGWRWAAQKAASEPLDGYWLGVAASALPAIAAWWSSLQLRAGRSNGHAEGIERAFDVLRWIAVVLLGFMALFPLL